MVCSPGIHQRRNTKEDKKLKKNVTSMEGSLDKIMQLHPVTYNWNDTALQYFTKDIKDKVKSLSGKPEDDQKLWEEERAKKYAEHSKV